MDAASVEAICERAGFTRGAFYSNFDSKEELFLALVTRLAGDKLDEVADRVRDLGAGDMKDPVEIARKIIGASLGENMEPQLLNEIRTQALRDPLLAQAYLTWQREVHARVEAIVAGVMDTYGIRLRLPPGDAAQLLLDVSDEACTRAAIEGRSRAEAGVLLNERIGVLVNALYER